MKLVRTIALALGISFATGGVLAGTALADDDREPRRPRWDEDADRGDHHHDETCNHDTSDTRDWERDDEDDSRWDRPGRWGHLVPVRFVNHRDRFVTLYLNGRYLGRVAPHARERFALPPGHHVVTYQVGRRQRYHQVSVVARPGQRNRVVIEGRGGWGGAGWGGGSWSGY